MAEFQETQKNEENPKRKAAVIDNLKPHSSIFDLRTTRGRILFLFISISFAVIIPTMNNAIGSFFKKTDQVQDHVVSRCKRPTYQIYSQTGKETHLHHVKNIFDRLGYEKVVNTTDWDVLWAFEYPFDNETQKLNQLQSHQKVNHFPGCGYLCNKVFLSIAGLDHIPKSFRLPQDREKFMNFTKSNPNTMVVQKQNDHRHISIKNVKEINFNDHNTFLQEFIENPLLVDGHKFDIGVYVIITSVDPLRVYLYKGDILFRYCPDKYYPLDVKNVDKYVVRGKYLPTWDVPALAKYYTGLGFGMRDSFDAYMRSKNRDPNVIWIQVEEIIRSTILARAGLIINEINSYGGNKRNFFEMMRFDLIADDNLRVYLMEANMSPNLESGKMPQNSLRFEQVIFNLMKLVGISSPIHRDSLRQRDRTTEEMMSHERNIVVYAEQCASEKCSDSCRHEECKLCRQCLSTDDIIDLHAAYREHLNRGDTRRLIPAPIKANEKPKTDNLSAKNLMMTKWFAGKCAMDPTWCL